MKPLAFLLLSLALLAQDKPKSADTSRAVKAAPTIPDALARKFWRAANDLNSIAPQYEKLKVAVDAARTEMVKYCADRNSAFDADTDGEPVCKVKSLTPETPKPETVKPETMKPEPAKPSK